MIAAPTPRPARLRRLSVLILTLVGAIVAVPFMLILLLARIGGDR